MSSRNALKYTIVGAILATGISVSILIMESPKEVIEGAPIATTTSVAQIKPAVVPENPVSIVKKPATDMKVVVANPSSFEGSLVSLINNERKTSLKESSVLDVRATKRALEICNVPFDQSAHNSFYTTPGKSILSDVSNGTGENLARNFDGDAKATHTGFMTSPTHKANIVSPIYVYVGIGHVSCPPNQYGTEEVTVEFFTGDAI